VPRLDDIEVNLPVLALSLLASILTGLVFSLLPAIQVTGTNLVAALQDDSRGSTSLRHSRTRDLLAVFEIALALVLLTGAGLLLRSFSRLHSSNPGFRTDGALTVQIAIARTKHNSDAKVAALCSRILERVRAIPGVDSAGMVNRLPLAGGVQTGPLHFEGGRPGTDIGSADWRTATPGYFQAIGIPLLAGRFFTEQDAADRPFVAVIDESIAKRVFGGDDPVGKRVRIHPAYPWATVVGVAGHIRHDALDRDQRPQIYWNYRQRSQDRMALVVRTQGDPTALTAPVVSAIRAVDPEQPVYDVRAMRDVVSRSVVQRWLSTVMLAVFSGVALLLASVGVYGVIAYSTARRIREFGIRVALGARSGQILGLVLRHGLTIAGVGTAIGLAASVVLTRLLGALLYEVSPTDPVTFAAVPLVLLLVALAACYLPARRATRIHPVAALRE
jgi:predicted permease